MMHSDDQKSELLWKHIEDIKCAENAGRTQLPPGATHNGAGLNGLTELAHAVYTSLQTPGETPEGLDSARARLSEAIRAERPATLPTIGTKENAGNRRRPFFSRDRNTLLIALALLLVILTCCFAIWRMNQNHCGTSTLTSSSPSVLPATKSDAVSTVSKPGAPLPTCPTPSALDSPFPAKVKAAPIKK